MSTYRIEVRPAALKALRSIHPTDKARIRGAIALLGEDPRPPGARALQGRSGLRLRVSVGSYHVIYTVDEGVLLVAVLTPGHRSDVYDV